MTAIEKSMDAAIEIEKMEAKMDEVMDKTVECWHCHECQTHGYTKESLCVRAGHLLTKVKAKLRWFTCNHCNKRTSAIGVRLLKRPCSCGAAAPSYSRASMLRKSKSKVDPGAPKLMITHSTVGVTTGMYN